MSANVALLGDAPFLILQLLLDGLMVGAIFAVAAYGMALVWGVMNGINAALCGAAGALVVMAYSVHPYIGLPYTVRSFMIVIVAGLGNLPGVIVAGLGLGAAENFAGFILGVQYQVAFVFCLLVVILVIRSTLLQRRRQFLK